MIAETAIILYQMRGHIAREILAQDPYAPNYWGREDVGEFLDGILSLGATRDWREVMREHLDEGISAAAMLEHFAPLMDYLKEENAGREHALPDSPAA